MYQTTLGGQFLGRWPSLFGCLFFQNSVLWGQGGVVSVTVPRHTVQPILSLTPTLPIRGSLSLPLCGYSLPASAFRPHNKGPHQQAPHSCIPEDPRQGLRDSHTFLSLLYVVLTQESKLHTDVLLADEVSRTGWQLARHSKPSSLVSLQQSSEKVFLIFFLLRRGLVFILPFLLSFFLSPRI